MRPASAVRLIPLLIFAATFAAFLPALSNSFVNWDDTSNFVNNPHYRGLGLSQIRWMFANFHLGHYQPVSWLTLGLDYLIWGLNPFGYHLTNLLLHGLNAVQFYFIALRLLASKENELDFSITGAAAFAALFFSLHPLRVESVAWATERRDVLSAFFYLATLQAYLKGSKAAWFLYPLALLSKVTAVTLPAVLLLLDYYPLRRPGIDLRGKIPFFLMALYAGTVGLLAQASSPALVLMEDYGMPSRLAQAVQGLPFYLWKTLIPLSLSPWYGESYLTSRISLAAAALALAAVTALFWAQRRRRPYWLAAWTCYAAMIFPSLGIVKSGRQIVADRFSYLPCLVWALLAGAAFGYLLPRARGKASAAALAWLLILGGLTWRQTTFWQDTVTLWSRALSLNEKSSLAQINLAVGLMQEERNEEALIHIEKQLELPQNPKVSRFLSYIGARARSNIGVDLAIQGKTAEALAQYRRALQMDPGAAQIHNNLGILFYQNGDNPAAIKEFEHALRVDPKSSETRANLERARKKIK